MNWLRHLWQANRPITHLYPSARTGRKETTMANCRDYRHLTLGLDEGSWRTNALPTAHGNPSFELARSVVLAHISESLNLIFSTTNVQRPHWCAHWGYWLAIEHDEEISACNYVGLVPSVTNPVILYQPTDLLPF